MFSKSCKRTRKNQKIDEHIYTEYFNSIFHFQKCADWILPNSINVTSKFVIKELQDFKEQLNNVKSELEQFDFNEWAAFRHVRDIASHVHVVLRNKVKPELLTQAWCKFYEIIDTFPLISPNEISGLRTLHLCEAPGAFVCSLNHYLVQNYSNQNWIWLANTLNPNYEGNSLKDMIIDDRLIYYKYDNWIFGADLTGDIRKYYNHLDIVKKASQNGKIWLVTADGSIDCSNNPGEQELLVEFLHYCETMTALKVLQTGGSFVLKIFTVFEHTTVCLLYLLNCVFTNVSIFKPFTSKAGNSELYVICLGFCGIEKLMPIWFDLIKPYEKGDFYPDTSMFSINDIPVSFVDQVLKCAKYYFINKQSNVIRSNIRAFLNPSLNKTDKFKTDAAEYFRKKFKLRQIPANKKVVPYANANRKIEIKPFQVDFISNNSKIYIKVSMLTGLFNIVQGHQINIVKHSKFVSENTLELLRTYDTRDTNRSTPPLYERILNHLNTACTIVNINQFILNPCHIYQKDLFYCLLSAIKQRKNILLINVPFHTYFLVGLWCILAAGFQYVHIISAGCMLFYQPLSSLSDYVLNCFCQIENAYNSLKMAQFPSDIVYLFNPYVFDDTLKFVANALVFYNSFSLPL